MLARFTLALGCVLIGILFSFSWGVAIAAPKISIIIDDLGNNYWEDQRVAQLPGVVVCSILPHTFFAVKIAHQCHANHKTVMLHVPMQALKPLSLGRGGLTMAMSAEQFSAVLRKDIAAIPHVAGVNNHMGSLLTQRAANMRWVMQILYERHLFFVDSRTSDNSVAYWMAQRFDVSTVKRDIFLDNIASYTMIDRQFQELLRIARRNGRAVAIGHPYPATVKYLQQNLPRLAEQGIELVSVVELVRPSIPVKGDKAERTAESSF